MILTKLTVQQVKKNSESLLTRIMIAVFFVITVNTSVNAQYSETFSTPNKGYLLNCVNDFAGVNWTLAAWDPTGTCQVADPRDPTDYFNTTGAGVLECIDLDQEVYWESPLLNISAAGTVTLAVALSWAGFDVDAAGNNCIGDFIRVQYSINGGAYTMVPNQVGGNPCATIAYPLGAPGAPFTASATVNQGGISGTSLRIRVVVFTNANAEMVTIDNVSVPQAGVTLNCTQPVITTTLRNIVCNGPSSGAINVTATGATPPYNVSWTGPSSGNPAGNEIAASGGTYTITGLVAGTYTITVTDAASCSQVTTATVISSPIVQSAITSPSSCGQSNGTIDLTVSGGNAPYTYLWSNSATTQDISGLTPGNYSVTITDASVPGCTSNATYTVGAVANGPYNETFSVVGKGYLINQVNNFFGVNWTMSPWTFNEPETNIGRGNDDYFQTTAAGRLEAVDTDMDVYWISPELNISASGTVNFAVNLLWTGFDNEDYISVQYSINGGAFVTIPNQFGGGAQTIQYAFPAVDQNNSFTVTQAGITGNRLQIRIGVLTNSQADVAMIDNVNIPQTVSLCLCPTITVTNPGVTTGTNGTAFSQTFTQSGGALPLTFSLNSGTLPNGLSLSAGGVLSGTPSAPAATYPVTIRVTDGSGCIGIGATYNLVISCQTITVTNPVVTTGTNGTPFSQTFTQTGALAGATFTINSGTLPTGLTLSAAGLLSGTPTQTGPFTITVRVTDGNGCIGTGPSYPLVISAPGPNMSASLRDALLVDVNGNTIANPGDQLRYTTTIRNTGTVDANGVNYMDTVPVNTTLNAGTNPVTSALARDDNFSAASNAPFNSGNVITNDFGVPSVTVVTFGTTASLGTTTAAGSAGTTNQGGTLTVNANGSFSYTSALNFTGTDQFMYIATTGVAGLPNNDAVVTITVTPDITFGTTKVDVLCNGASTGSITFTGVSGGSGPVYTFSVNGVAGPFQVGNPYTGLAAGSYTPAVRDGSGYIKTGANVIITQPPALSFTHVDVPNTCNGASAGSITITASGGTGGYTYSKNGPGGPFVAGNAFTGLAGGTHSISARDANLCIVTQSVTLTDPPIISFTTTPVNITCNGANNGSITFTASGGTGTLNYSITGAAGTYQASNTFTGLTPGTYNPAVRDANNCIVTAAAITLTQPAAIVVSGTVPQLTFNVAMTPVTFTKTNGAGSPANPWSVSSGTLPTNLTLNTATGQLSGTPNQVGLFPVTIRYTDANGCFGNLSITIDVGANLGADTYTNVGNTQLMGGAYTPAPTTPKVDVVSVAGNDNSNQTITYAMVGTPSHGNITMNTDGTFIYQPGFGNSTTATFGYSGTSNGTVRNQTVTINFNGMVWYIQGGAAAGTGMSNSPRNSMPSGPIGATGDFIYVMKELAATNPPGTITMLASQKLIGAGATLNVPTVSPVLIITGVAGNTPTLINTITLANSVTVDGIDMSTTTNNAVTNAGNTVTGVNFTARNVTTSTGAGIALTGTGNNVTMTMTSLTTNGAINAVNLISTAGTVTINGGTWIGGAGATFNINGGTVSTTYSGNITQATASAPMVNVGGGHTGTVTFNTGSLSATNGTGFQFNNADGTYNFNGTTTMNGGDAAIDLSNGCGGTFNIPAGISITNPTNEVISILNSTANFTYGGGFTKNNNNISGITITGNTGGTIAINGSGTKTLSTGTGNAVNLITNTGTTINFSNNNLVLTTTSGIGFNATGGTTAINVTGTGNTITSTTGTALNVVNTTIGASNINFQSISSSGGSATGIILDNTGASGGLIVNGDGTNTSMGGNSTGGTIANKSGADGATTTGCGIYLNNTRNVVLRRMTINGTNQNYAIRGLTVTNFNLEYSTVAGTNGDNAVSDEGSIRFSELTGSATVLNCNISGGFEDNFRLGNTSGTLNRITFTGTTIGANSTTDGNDGITIETLTSAHINVTVQNCTFTSARGDLFQFNSNASSGATDDLIFNNNMLSNNHPGIATGGGGTSIFSNGSKDFTFHIEGNSFRDAVGHNVLLAKTGGTGIYQGTFSNNTIGVTGVANSGSLEGSGLKIQTIGGGVAGTGGMTVAVTGNTIQQYNNDGILFQAGGGAPGDGTGFFNVTATANIVGPLGTNIAVSPGVGIRVTSGTGVGDNFQTCAVIGGAGALKNILTGSGITGTDSDYRVRQRFSTTVRLPGYGGAAGDITAVVNFIDANNTITAPAPGGTATVAFPATGGGFVGGAACILPTN